MWKMKTNSVDGAKKKLSQINLTNISQSDKLNYLAQKNILRGQKLITKFDSMARNEY
jgi:hypothetical protein